MINLFIIDGQGGQLGSQLIKSIKMAYTDCTIFAIGTNTSATTAMLKAGAAQGATGENAVLVAARKADIIIGPIGIVIADSLLGEITPKMAVAIGQSNAKRILIPMNKCDNIIAGTTHLSTSMMMEDVLHQLDHIL